MLKVEERKKLLVDQYDIHTVEEFCEAYDEMKASIGSFMSLFGKENHEIRKDTNSRIDGIAHCGDRLGSGNGRETATELDAGSYIQLA